VLFPEVKAMEAISTKVETLPQSLQNKAQQASRRHAAAIIPARFASTRFPGKPLADISGCMMIERFYRHTAKS